MDISTLWPQLEEILQSKIALSILRALFIVALGLLLTRLVVLALRRMFKDTTSPHRAILIQRSVYYLLLTLFLLAALTELGFDLGVLLGAAGILTVAIGFASQTSMSNLISGLFLIGERPFAIGDIIKVDTTVGEVLSIDLLSVKLRAFDNTFIRIPNESIIKTQVTTLTKFPIRRIDLQIAVAYKEDIANVKRVLFEVADKNPLCLEEPQPLFIFQGYGESAINIQFSVWGRTDEYINLKSLIQIEIKAAFVREGIEIPYPHRSLYTGALTEPFPVRVAPEPVTTGDKPAADTAPETG